MDKLTQFLLSIGIAVLLPVVVVFGVFTVVPNKEVPAYPSYVSPPSCTYQYDQLTQRTGLNCTPAEQSAYQAQQNSYDEAVRTYERTVKENSDSNLLRAELALGVGVAMFLVAVAARNQSKELSAGLVIGSSIVVLGAVGVIAAEIGQLDSSSARLVGSLFALVGFVVLTAVIAVIEHAIKENQVITNVVSDKSTDPTDEKALMIIENKDSTTKSKEN